MPRSRRPSAPTFFACLVTLEWPSASAGFEQAVTMATMRARIGGPALVVESGLTSRGAVALVTAEGALQPFLFPVRGFAAPEARADEPEYPAPSPFTQMTLFQEG